MCTIEAAEALEHKTLENDTLKPNMRRDMRRIYICDFFVFWSAPGSAPHIYMAFGHRILSIVNVFTARARFVIRPSIRTWPYIYIYIP